ncbi:arylamine N-acetyltransferase [Halobaculum sp. MBLA0143]|uniref:arylamine N-acetyltransferase family protein n=1 Tax=Halobaculum sp. MBLA0143 TaxID=3079933 RepID=UPI00352317CE
MERYLERVGVEPEAATEPNLETLGRLQAAHVTAVPFETLSVSAGTREEWEPSGVPESLAARYEKVVERGRGGICYELNGLFYWLLTELGFEVSRLGARVFAPDGSLGPPGDHQTLLISLDEPYLADVGFGGDVIRTPLPFDGTPREGPCGAWRLTDSDRRDADYVAQSRGFDGDDWRDRFVFETTHRERSYFEPAREYHQDAPDATFTDWTLAVVATEDGYRTLTDGRLTVTTADGRERRPVDESSFEATLAAEFGIPVDG